MKDPVSDELGLSIEFVGMDKDAEGVQLAANPATDPKEDEPNPFDVAMAEQQAKAAQDVSGVFDKALEDMHREQGEDVASTQMYEGMTQEEAQEKFDLISSSPNVKKYKNTTSVLFTDPNTGRNEIILAPSGAYFDAAGLAVGDLWDGEFKKAGQRFTKPNATVSTPDKIMAGLVESGGAVLKTGAAIAEKLGGMLGIDSLDGLVEAASEQAAYIDTAGDISDSLLTDAVPAVVAGAPAMKVNALLQGSTLLVRGLATALTAEVGATASMSLEEGTAFIGENASVLPIARGINMGGSDPSEADKIISHRLNTLAEGLAIVGIGQPAGVAVEVIGSLVMKFLLIPLGTGVLGKHSAIERRVYAELMQSIAQLDGNLGLTPTQEARARQHFLQILEDNKDIYIKGLNTIKGDEAIVLDTVSAILRGLDPENEVDQPTIAVLKGIRQQHLTNRAGSGQTAAVLEGPQRALHGELTGTAKKIGGETVEDQTTTIRGASDEFATDGRQMIDDAAETVARAQEAYDEAVVKLTEDIGTNLGFAGDLSRVVNAVGTAIAAPKTGMRGEVQQYLKQAYESMGAKKSALYAEVSGGVVDPQTLRAVFSDVTPENMTKASGIIRTSSPLHKLMDLVQPKEIIEEIDGKSKPRFETDEETNARIQGVLDAEGLDFGFFYKEIRPELSQLASELYTSSQTASGILREVIADIDGKMLDDVAASDSELAEAARAAKKYYVDEYAPLWRSDGKLQDYSNIYDGTINRGEGFQHGFVEQSAAFTKDILTGYNADSVHHLEQALRAGGDPKSAGVVVDYILLDIFTNLARDVAAGGGESVNLGQVSDMVAQYAEVLNKTFPAKADQVNEFLELIQASSNDKEALATVLANNAGTMAKAKETLAKSELSKFMSSVNPDDLLATGSAYEAFESILQNKGKGPDTIKALVTRADTMDPLRKTIVMDGMTVAYMRFLKKRIFSVSQEAAGAPVMRKADTSDMEGEVNSYLEMGKTLFKDTPEWMAGFTNLLSVAGQIAKQKQGPAYTQGVTNTVFLQEAKTASGRAINMTLGPLNSMGTKVRSIIGAMIEAGNTAAIAQKIIDRIYADPTYVLSLAKRFDKAPMDPLLKQQFIMALVGGGTKEMAAMEGGDQKQQMSDIFATKKE